jgi:hypothetical protein
MVKLLHILVYAYLILPAPSHPRPKEWRGIVPLKSTRADVERLLGAPDEPGGTLYILENENVLVWYSNGSCERNPKGWNVPRGVVTEFTVYYATKLPASTLKLDESKYEKFNDPEVKRFVYYKNEDEGILIQVDTNLGVVNNITFFPEAKDNYLRCPGSTIKNSSGEVDDGIIDSQKFDEYFDIPFSEEKGRLDYFATGLLERQRNESEAKGYIIAYAGRGAHIGEARIRAERAKSYLVNERGMKAKDIEAIDGGYRETATVELWIRPNGGSTPKASPTVAPSEVRIIKAGSARNNRHSSQPRRKQRQSCQ